MPMLIEIYSDVVCPWCYIGERRFFQALDETPEVSDVEVVFRPFQLDPREPTTPRPLLEALAGKFGPHAERATRHATEAGRGVGIEFDWERAVATNTFDAHRLLWLALAEYGSDVQRALAERLFAAHFSEGGDVGDARQLAEHAAAAGMNQDRAAALLGSREGADEVRSAIEHAVAIGVSAVPTFVFDGRYAVSGAQPAEVFRRVIEEVAAGRVET
jgi:predicted DsbA family dithiol-disulfide isomerase